MASDPQSCCLSARALTSSLPTSTGWPDCLRPVLPTLSLTLSQKLTHNLRYSHTLSRTSTRTLTSILLRSQARTRTPTPCPPSSHHRRLAEIGIHPARAATEYCTPARPPSDLLLTLQSRHLWPTCRRPLHPCPHRVAG